MKRRNITIAVFATIAIGTVAYYLIRRSKEERRAIDIADAGYETAHDILYPMRKKGWRRQQGFSDSQSN